jgi:hypothetical protein
MPGSGIGHSANMQSGTDSTALELADITCVSTLGASQP